MNQISLKGIVDMHVHTLPDIRERAYNDFELMEAAIRVGARAIVIKSHHGTTMNRAFLVNEYNKMKYKGNNDFVMYGSITLNYAIGGLNPIAVETGFKMGAKVIWLPTIHAKNQLEKNGKSGGIECVKNGKSVPELKEILKLIKDYNAVLGTGHLSPQEIRIVVEEAKNMGIDKIVITHPEFWVVGMTVDEQIKMVKEYGVYLERCYAQPMGGGVYKSNLKDNLEIIKKLGCEHVMVDTDGGQVENPNWEIAFQEYTSYLLNNGITKAQLEIMTKKIPYMLLDI